MENHPKFTRALSLRERVDDTFSDHRNELVALLSRYLGQEKRIMQPHELIDQLDSVIGDDGTKQQQLYHIQGFTTDKHHTNSKSPACCSSTSNTCVHRNPIRALDDLTGIEKHFCRKYGETKWTKSLQQQKTRRTQTVGTLSHALYDTVWGRQCTVSIIDSTVFAKESC
ncbi:hypothetical protein ACFX13_038887 [Malus domestica]